MARGRGRKIISIKDQQKQARKQGLSKRENLGNLMRKHRQIQDLLFTYTANQDMVYDEMDFTIEEFSDMTGADLVELLEELEKAIKRG